VSNLIVLTFDDPEQADQVRETLRQEQRGGYVALDDSAIVVRDQEGKVHVRNEIDRGVKVGALGGGMLGVLIGSIFFPFAGLLVGVLGGALVGASLDMGIQKKFVQQVADDLQPGTSALFIIVRDADPDMALAALRPYTGKVYHTSLSPEAEENLRHTLSQKIG
jgi:uncharacterized membrane protein